MHRGAVTESSTHDGPRRGRPRSESSRKAIIAAARELLLEHGLNSVSMDAVADRAGASKATIYRWWPSKELLALDALFSQWEFGMRETPDTGSLVGDLLALIRPWARQLAKKPYGRIMAGLVSSAQSDPMFAREYRARFVQPRRKPARIILARAVERGEIPLGFDIEAILDLLYGPFYLRILNGHAPVNDRFARTVVDCVAAALARPAQSGGSPNRRSGTRSAAPKPVMT
ncbi:MAG TPA: TetR/AcrR family transcriptional regulator [Solirubrobacteraceae bacterium]|jgi:AcrR family transcriptional regulator|nr:TetR/AcrR family transcriptional regulator [Solirubrobacteraceae bacterium]